MKSHRQLIAALACATALYAAEPTTPREPSKPASNASTEGSGSKSEQLAAAQKELAAMRLRHDEKHPAYLKQRAKVARLQKDVRDEQKVDRRADPSDQLAAAKRDLDRLLERYTDEHPTVKAQRKRIADLEQQAKK